MKKTSKLSMICLKMLGQKRASKRLHEPNSNQDKKTKKRKPFNDVSKDIKLRKTLRQSHERIINEG